MADEEKEVQEEQTPNPEPEPKPEPAKAEEEEPVKDKHGQVGINKERHDKEVNALKETIKELQSQLDEQAKTEKGREEMGKKIAELEQKLADSELNHRLEMEKCRNAKAARALLEDYGGDISKLKEENPWLFEEEKPQGATGGKPSAPSTAGLDEELRKATGLKPMKG